MTGFCHLRRPHGVRVGCVGQDDPGDPGLQRPREHLAEGQGNHPSNAVPDEYRGTAAGDFQHGSEIGGKVFHPEVIAIGLLRQAHAGDVPDDEPESIRKKSFLIEPFGTIGAPAVRPDDRGGVRRTVALHADLTAVGSINRMNRSGPVLARVDVPFKRGVHRLSQLCVPPANLLTFRHAQIGARVFA
jgi:hypothetical protein